MEKEKHAVIGAMELIRKQLEQTPAVDDIAEQGKLEGAKEAEVFVKQIGDKSVNTLEMSHFQNGPKKGFLNAPRPNSFWYFLKWKKNKNGLEKSNQTQLTRKIIIK